ncbi:Fe-S cluster assembly protein SufD [Lapidilactobacillus achengensis]|uniref:Fe-S cluster assembly protein SufD n=1 Tax=Lapidilactobacillus achengensis TaxID=2486000 RepID=A0ABW1UNI9_9LACO|nr:Fe-S cluster assembly protein SufD [Lapidilactobacillus achengensis]
MVRVKPFTTAAELATFSADHHEMASLAALRQQALAAYPQLPLPTFEKIRYQRWPLFNGNLAPEQAANQTVTSTSMSAPVAPLATTGAADQEPAMIQQLDLQVPRVQLSAEAQAQGVVALDFFQAQREYPELFAKYYGTLAAPALANRLAAFHTAAVNGGLLIYLPAGAKLTAPLTLELTQSGDNGQLYAQHLLLVAGENSEATILATRHTTTAGSASANIVEELILEQGAQLRYTAIDGLKNTTYLARRAYLFADARIDWALGEMNDGDIVTDFNTDLVGNGSQADFKAVAISTGSQFQGITTRLTNYGLHTVANILQHGVILSDATLTFNGVGHIVKGARDSDSQQENRVLMLSRTARGDANPILLIDENDVRAGHAASVGRVNESQMYYLMSRGLSKDLAERLVIRGFLGSVLTEIPVAAARAALTATIERKLIDGQRHRDRAQ